MKPKALPDPAEWSFREIDEVELPFAIEYELARESDLIRPAVEKVLSMKVGNRTAREMILSDVDSERNMATMALFRSGEKLKIWDFAMQNPLFPAPWNLLEPEDRIAAAKDVKLMKGGALKIISDPKRAADYLVSRSGSNDLNYINAALTIDLSRRDSKEEILAQFKVWLDRALAGRRARRGKAVTPPWHILKALAALRLKNAGVTFDQSLREMKARQSQSNGYASTQGAAEALPLYLTKFSWSAALKRARKAIRDLEKSFGY